MYDRYNVELTNDYLNNTCTMGNRFGMFPTVEMIEEYNTINFRPSILPTKQTSQLRALFAEVIPSTDSPLFAINRFKKLVGYRNILFPLSMRYPTLQEMANELMNITSVHDIANYGKFARMLQVVTEQNNIPVTFNKIEQWENEKVSTPNETISTESEQNNTTTITDNTENGGTVTTATTTAKTDRKTGTDTTAKTGTESTSGNESDTMSDVKSLSETITEKVAPFDSETFNNEKETTTTNRLAEDKTESKTNSETLTHNTTDTTTHNTTDTINGTISETETINTTVDKSVSNLGNTEKTETKTRTGENEETENGHRYINTGLSMAELIERENVLLPVFDMYLLSIAREITLSSVEEIY